MDIQIRRAYDPPGRGDGYRVLVDRVWPRGVSGQDLDLDEWRKQIAPSTRLREWFDHDPERWKGFQERHFAELEKKADAVRELVKRAPGSDHARLRRQGSGPQPGSRAQGLSPSPRRRAEAASAVASLLARAGPTVPAYREALAGDVGCVHRDDSAELVLRLGTYLGAWNAKWSSAVMSIRQPSAWQLQRSVRDAGGRCR
jgi:uncharacterized protein YeaO (DUF488 family)